MRLAPNRVLLAATFASVSLLVPRAAAAGAGAAPHGQGRLWLERRAVAIGDTLRVRGTEFEPGRYRLRLAGSLASADLGTVTADSDGRFAFDWHVAAVRPGAYRLVAIAEDGDEATREPVEILPAAPTAAAGSGAEPGTAGTGTAGTGGAVPDAAGQGEPGHGGPGHAAAGHAGPAAAARADAMPLERRRSPFVWGLLAGAVLATAALGVVWLRG
jgi:hypothetical protein